MKYILRLTSRNILIFLFKILYLFPISLDSAVHTWNFQETYFLLAYM